MGTRASDRRGHPRRVDRHTLDRRPAPVVPAFQVDAFLGSAGVAKSAEHDDRGETVFAPGDACDHVLYVRACGVTLSVRSSTREAVVAVLGPGDVFGEECLAGQRGWVGNATAIAATDIRRVGKRAMTRGGRGPMTIDRSLLSLVLCD